MLQMLLGFDVSAYVDLQYMNVLLRCCFCFLLDKFNIADEGDGA